jgi:peptidyl-prolyl cis-trans isomerase SurA
MRIVLLLMLVFLGVFYAHDGHASASEGIAVVVNEGAITRSDVEDRYKLIAISSGLPNSEATRARLLPQIVGALIEEEIRLQEGKKIGVTVTDAEIAEGFKQIATQNKFTPEQFREVLARSGINPKTMERQIRSQIAWGKVVQSKIRPQISVSESDVNSRMAMIESNKGKNENLLAEIFIAVDETNTEAKAQQLAQQLAQDISGGKVPFSKVAQQFSQSPGSAQGGDLGWVQVGQLAPELDQAIAAAEVGKITQPVRSLSGYHIFLVRERRVLSDDNMPSREAVMNSIGQERLERQARRYLMDLKSAAYIDNRFKS